MGTKTAGNVIEPALAILNDVQGIRFVPEAMLAHVNAGQVQACQLRPALYTHTIAHDLVPGVLQSIPSDGVSFIRVHGNVDVMGDLLSPVLLVDRLALDRQRPGWASDTPSATVERVMYDNARPTKFDVYPAQPGTPGRVRLVYAALPPESRTLNSPISLDDAYVPALTDYVLYRAYGLNAEYGNNQVLSMNAYQSFILGIQASAQAAASVDPKVASSSAATVEGAP